MKKVLFVVLGAGALACGGLTVGGCGDDTATGGAAAATGTVTVGVTSSSSKASASATSSKASSGSGTATASTGSGSGLTCDNLCDSIQANCSGSFQQYASMAECVTDCTTAAAPAGAETDHDGNTMGCHIYHAGAAASAPTPHCWHAGFPSVEPDGTTPGPCVD